MTCYKLNLKVTNQISFTHAELSCIKHWLSECVSVSNNDFRTPINNFHRLPSNPILHNHNIKQKFRVIFSQVRYLRIYGFMSCENHYFIFLFSSNKFRFFVKIFAFLVRNYAHLVVNNQVYGPFGIYSG